MILKLWTCDYIVDITHHAKFDFSQYIVAFSPNRQNIATWSFLPVLSCPFFLFLHPGWTARPIFMLYGSNNMILHYDSPFGGYDNGWCHLGKCAPKTPTNGRNWQFHPKYQKINHISSETDLDFWPDDIENVSGVMWTWLRVTVMNNSMHTFHREKVPPKCVLLWPWPLTSTSDHTPCGAGAPLFPPCPFTSSSFPLFTFPFLSLALPIFFFCPSLPFLPE